ncbi:MAG: energy-coupling factor transporter transmembrane protein EcfT [Acholeplasmatales bacterium]|nr:energy-coupling factor transporter transmembrane protein EcfT [Acholeplasmatales bacterium]
MNNISFGQYVPGNSWIYKLDPRTKVLLTIALIVLVFIIPSLITISIAFGVVLLIYITSRIPILKVLKGLKGIIFLLLFTFVVQIIYTKNDGMPLYSFNMEIGLWQFLIIAGFLLLYIFTKKFVPSSIIYLLVLIFVGFCILWCFPFEKFYWNFNMSWAKWSFNVYQAGLERAAYIFLRILLMIFLTSLLTLSTMTTDINNAISWLLTPLKIFKIPVEVFSMLISLTLRFIPTLILEANKIMAAQASRGLDFNEAKLSKKVKQIIALLIPLFVISFKTADELSNAMEARGYVIGAPRTQLDELKFRPIDLVATLVVVGFYVGVILNMVGVY